jgi:DNA-binding MarR family transcriptional regulator
MDNAHFLTLKPNELAEMALDGLTRNDNELLENVDSAFHHIFLERSKKGSEDSRDEFIDAVLSATEFVEREAHLDLRHRRIVRWVHLAELMEAFKQDRDRIAEAIRLLKTGKHLKIFQEIIAKNDGAEWMVFQLAKKLGLSCPNLVSYLNVLERHDIIQRHRAGRNAFVSIGLVGQLIAQRLKAEQNLKEGLSSVHDVGSRRFPPRVLQQYYQEEATSGD